MPEWVYLVTKASHYDDGYLFFPEGPTLLAAKAQQSSSGLRTQWQCTSGAWRGHAFFWSRKCQAPGKLSIS